MNLIRTVLIFVSFFAFNQISFGQASSDLRNTLNWSSGEWNYYVDQESKTYFIDFESLTVNLNSVVVKNASGAVLMEEQVSNLPVNSIYEINLGKYGPGDYQIELHTLTGVMRKSLAVK